MLEIACFNVSSAIIAANTGVDRIELCAKYAAGGVTPSYDSFQLLCKEIKIAINVMIRPRAGDFNYSDSEFQQMKSEIQLFKPEASGFVFGILDDKNHVDEQRSRQLVELAAPLPCTFHRAFDQVPDLFKATEQVISCGFKSILTSGGQSSAQLGAGKVAELQTKFGKTISFILGGGIRSTNIEVLQRQTGVPWLHSAAITGSGELVDEDEIARLLSSLKK